jgi:NADH:ubiquinone oxidoreductase subunit 6 (subunit J)
MSVLFYGSAIIAILATLMVITRTNVVHALLYFIVSLLAIAVIFYALGAPGESLAGTFNMDWPFTDGGAAAD